MNRFKGIPALIFVISALAAMALTGYAVPEAKAGESFPCVSSSNLDKQIAPEAELKEFSCFFKKWEGRETLHFNVAVKNVCKEDQRFKVNIFLDNGKGVGGLIPAKIKKGLVKPGETATAVYPVTSMSEKPKSIMLVIKTMAK